MKKKYEYCGENEQLKMQKELRKKNYVCTLLDFIFFVMNFCMFADKLEWTQMNEMHDFDGCWLKCKVEGIRICKNTSKCNNLKFLEGGAPEFFFIQMN